jgi:plasmid stability protein
MPTLTIKGIPDTLYRRLKSRAEEHRRSLNSEVIVCLEQSLNAQRIDVEDFLKRAQTLRRRLEPIYLRDRELNAAKRAGRP